MSLTCMIINNLKDTIMAKDWYKKYKNLVPFCIMYVLLISIDQEKMNATDGPTHNGLSRVWLDVGDDPDVRVVVVTGCHELFQRVAISTGLSPW